MDPNQNSTSESLMIRGYFILSALAWTLFLVVLLSWNIKLIKSEALNRAYVYARVGFDKDVLYRRWVAEHGGVYVVVDSATQPNPYLAYLPNRDIYIDSVLRFTMMNPAYMTREVFSLQEKTSTIRGHITSMHLLNPNNAPDEWEKRGLLAFEKGAHEYVSVDTLEGKEYFRFMKPFITEENCLQCHAQQGYKAGDIRGGISVSYPLDELYFLSDKDLRNQYYLYGILWLLGIGIISIFYIRLARSDKKRKAAEQALLDLNAHLEEEIKIRSLELQKSQNDWENIFNTLGTPAQIIDKDHIIRHVNEETLLFFNLKREDLIDKKCHALFHLSSNPPSSCPLVRAKVDNKLSIEEMPFEYNNKAFIVSCSPIRDIDGKIQQFIHIMTDITNRRKMEQQLKESEERWQFALEGSQDGVWDWNLETNTVFFSKRWKEMLGYDDHEISNNFSEWDSRVHPDDRAKSYANLEKHFSGELGFMELEHRLQCKGGQYKWILSRGKILQRAADNKPLRIIGTHSDISLRKSIEHALSSSERLLRLFVDHSPASIAMFDNNMQYIVASDRYKMDYKLKNKTLIGLSHYEVFPEIPERWKEIHKRCLAGETIKEEEDVFPRTDGSIDYVRWEMRPWLDENERIGGIILFSEVITTRKLAEENLRISHQMIRNIIDNSPSLIYLFDAEGKFMLGNKNFEDLLDFPMTEVIGKSREQFFPKDIAEYHKNNDLWVINTKQPLTMDEENEEPDGKHFYMTVKFPLINSAGEVYAVGGISTDITERKKTEKALMESEERFSRIFMAAPGSMILSSLPDGKSIEVNENFSLITGFSREEALGKTTAELNMWAAPSARDQFLSILQTNDVVRDFEADLNHKSGAIRKGLVSGHIFTIRDIKYLLGTFFDITERKQVEEELKKHRENLEILVGERTQQLVDKNAELQRINKLFVGRELRMKELKDEINRLKGTE